MEAEASMRSPALPPDVPAGRVPEWRLDALVHRACPACDADGADPVCERADRLVVARCSRCDMLYVPEIPDERQLVEFYGGYTAWKGHLPRMYSWKFRLSPIKPRNPHIEILRRSGGLDAISVCEIGCSHGAFLLHARRAGAKVFGVEIDDVALSELERRGIPASRRLPNDRRFDVVCAFHLIEHLAQPAAWLDEVAAALAPRGRLLLAMPNGGEANRVGPGWIGYRVDLEHLNYFDVGSLSRILSRSGLWIEQFWESSQPELGRGPARRGWDAWWSAAVDRASTIPVPQDGTFVLTALARRGAES